MDNLKVYISVILPLRLEWNPYYYVDSQEVDKVYVGMRVVVMFAGRRYVGVVSNVGVSPNIDMSKVCPIQSVESGLAPVSEKEIKLWQLVADYYLCTIGEVYQAAYPTFRVSAELKEERAREKAELALAKKKTKLESKLQRLQTRLERKKILIEKAKTRADKLKQEILSLEAEIESVRGSISLLSEEKVSSKVVELYRNVELNSAQQDAKNEILRHFERQKTVLLHGVTGSGKTEIYISLAKDVIEAGGSVLYLIPEIAVSHQLEERLYAVLGDKLLVYHSKESSARRKDVAGVVREGGHLVLGTRSAVFLPYNDLKLIIIDEEQDNSYKQDSPSPRYNGRDTALFLSMVHGASVVLGTATPSLESIYNCNVGKWCKVSLNEKYFGAADAEVEIIDTIAERKKRGMRGSFSFKLIEHIRKTIEGGGQVLLLRARRSYSPSVQCSDCGYIPKCPHCNVPLSLHGAGGHLLCHYCGFKTVYTGICSTCGGQMISVGAGTQRIEEETNKLFPGVSVARLDSDVPAGSETGIIHDFAQGKTRILIGTQVLTKGFDFGGVSLVAVIQADSLLGVQDYKADEKAYQILEQFRGRCGRRGEVGRFVIQTARPEHPVYQMIQGKSSSSDDSLTEVLMSERELYGYPPYRRQVCVILKDRYEDRLDRVSASLADRVKKEFGVSSAGFVQLGDGPVTVLGPYAPQIDKVSDFYIRHLRLCFKKNKYLSSNKKRLYKIVLETEKETKGVGRIVLDVDPV